MQTFLCPDPTQTDINMRRLAGDSLTVATSSLYHSQFHPKTNTPQWQPGGVGDHVEWTGWVRIAVGLPRPRPPHPPRPSGRCAYLPPTWQIIAQHLVKRLTAAALHIHCPFFTSQYCTHLGQESGSSMFHTATPLCLRLSAGKGVGHGRTCQ
jgi:hypothetical protein